MLKQVIEVYELLDDAGVDGRRVSEFLREKDSKISRIREIRGERGKTDFIKAGHTWALWQELRRG